MATFSTLVRQVADRLNLTSDMAMTRIGERLNERYREVTSSIGLITSRRQVLPFTFNSIADTTLPELTIEGFEKIARITLVDPLTIPNRPLDELTYDEITNTTTGSGLPRAWAVKKMLSGKVEIVLDAFPDATDFDVKVDGYEIADTLADDAEPAFPADFHDILVAGAMADEYDKMEKPQLALKQEQRFQHRLSALRLFIAVSGYLEIYQGKTRTNRLWPYEYR